MGFLNGRERQGAGGCTLQEANLSFFFCFFGTEAIWHVSLRLTINYIDG